MKAALVLRAYATRAGGRLGAGSITARIGPPSGGPRRELEPSLRSPGSALWSTALAALPIVVLLGGIGLLHLKAHVAALLGLVVALCVAVIGFGMRPRWPGPPPSTARRSAAADRLDHPQRHLPLPAHGADRAVRHPARLDRRHHAGPAAAAPVHRVRRSAPSSRVRPASARGGGDGRDADGPRFHPVARRGLSLIANTAPSPTARSALRDRALSGDVGARSHRRCPR